MFEPFSSGYFVGRLYVEPHDGERTLLHRDQHERVYRDLYTTGSGIERLDRPLIMKLDNYHFAVEGEAGVPEDTLYVPRSEIDPDPQEPLPALREVLLAKAHRASYLMSILGIGDRPSGT